MTDSVENITISSGIKRLQVNGDPNRIIKFNPSDTNFVDRFYKLMSEMDKKSAEFERRGFEIDSKNGELDKNGLPVNMQESIDLMKEICVFMKENIDKVFGPGTSRAAFGEELSIEMFGEFFDAIKPFISRERSAKIAKYVHHKRTKK